MNGLEPARVWQHFQTLCAIPRPSKHEDASRAHIRSWAQGRGLATAVDEAGNLLLRKRATAGREQRPGVALQGHLDMVSFGPTIRGAHAPGESVEIVAVAKAWRLLAAILAAI